MVVFTCQKCNSTLKKSAVEKHFSCRPFLLTCIDCLKDFRGKEYDEHKSCITEDQKYGGSKVVVKAHGEKQGKWVEIAQEALTGISHIKKFQNICLSLKEATNIPRKRSKFHNYVKSTAPRIYDSQIVDEIFTHIEKAKNNNKEGAKSQHISSTDVTTVTATASTEEIMVEVQDESGNSTKKRKKIKKHRSLEENGVENNPKTDVIDSVVQSIKCEDPCKELPSDEVNIQVKDKQNKSPLTETEQKHDAQLNSGKVSKSKERRIRKQIQASMNKSELSLNKWFEIVENETSNHQNKENEEISRLVNKNESLGNSELTKEGESNTENLSRKKRKKLEKQKKYMAEVAEIESAQPEEECENLEKEENIKKKKKKQKRNIESAASETSPKRKLEADVVEIEVKRMKLNETLQEEEIPFKPGKKFKWGNVIKQILENSSNKELPLKKLRKKVMAEYQVQKGDDVPYEKLLGIFNKKVNSTEGVKVLKDKAFLTNN